MVPQNPHLNCTSCWRGVWGSGWVWVESWCLTLRQHARKRRVGLLFELKQNRAFGFCLWFLYGNARGAGFKMTGIYGALGFWGVKVTITSISLRADDSQIGRLISTNARRLREQHLVGIRCQGLPPDHREELTEAWSLVCSSGLQWRSSSLPTQAVASDKI